MSAPVYALTVFDVGNVAALYAGGAFWGAYDSGDAFIAKWRPETTPPTLHCPSAVVKPDRFGSSPGEVVTFSVTATDECDPSPVVVCNPPSGSFFPAGKTLVTCTATDASGNQATCHFVVTVVRGLKPH
jgi:hypothetical protein